MPVPLLIISMCNTLSCIIHYTALPYHIHFDLPWIIQFRFDLFGYIPGQQYHVRITDIFWKDHHTDLTPRLDGKRFLHALEAVRDVFELF